MFHLYWVRKFEIKPSLYPGKDLLGIWAEYSVLGTNDFNLGRIVHICGSKKYATIKMIFTSIHKMVFMNRFKLTIISVLILVMCSCEKSETETRISIYGEWELIDFMSVESYAYPKDDGFNPVIEFQTGGSYILKLDANNCFGDFTMSNGNSISISAPGCTKMCCDSEFSQKFVAMLSQVKTFQIENNKLKLEVPNWGWISLNLYD